MIRGAVTDTHSKHGAEVAEVGEQLLHRSLLGIHSKIFQHVLIERLHVAVHDHQLAVLFSCNFAEAVRVRQGQQHIGHKLQMYIHPTQMLVFPDLINQTGASSHVHTAT